MTYIVVCNGFHMLWIQYAYAVKSYSYMETMPAKEHFLRALWNVYTKWYHKKVSNVGFDF